MPGAVGKTPRLTDTGNATVARIAAEMRTCYASKLHRGAQPMRNFRELRAAQDVEVQNSGS